MDQFVDFATILDLNTIAAMMDYLFLNKFKVNANVNNSKSKLMITNKTPLNKTNTFFIPMPNRNKCNQLAK